MNIDKNSYVQSYARQQQILSHLGFYEGKIDGFWGPKTVAAKKAFERDTRFKPAIPNSGQPFAFNQPLPSCIYPSESGLLSLHDVDDSVLPKIDEDLVKSFMEKGKKEHIKVKAAIGRESNEVYVSDTPNPRYKEVDKTLPKKTEAAASIPA